MSATPAEIAAYLATLRADAEATAAQGEPFGHARAYGKLLGQLQGLEIYLACGGELPPESVRPKVTLPKDEGA